MGLASPWQRCKPPMGAVWTPLAGHGRILVFQLPNSSRFPMVTDTVAAPFPVSRFLGPRYWINWLGVDLLWLAVQLPYRWQLALGRGLGWIMRQLAKYRGRGDTARVN